MSSGAGSRWRRAEPGQPMKKPVQPQGAGRWNGRISILPADLGFPGWGMRPSNQLAGDVSPEVMPVDRHDSLAGLSPTKTRWLFPCGAGLPANLRAEQFQRNVWEAGAKLLCAHRFGKPVG